MGMLVSPYRHAVAGGGGSVPGYQSAGFTQNSITPSFPASIASGDMLIAVVVANTPDATLDYSPPSGFQLLTTVRTATTVVGCHTSVWWKIADGTESGTATFTVNAGGANAHQAYVIRFTGATKIEGLRAFVTANSTTEAISSPAITTTVAGAVVCNLISTPTAQTVIPEAGWTEQFEAGANNIGGNDFGLALHTMPAIGTGAQATEEPTPGGGVVWSVISFALCPSGSTTAQSATVRGSRAVHVNNANSVSFTLPTGSQAGDRCVIAAGHGWGVTIPTGWFSLSKLDGSNFNGATFEKVLSPADITAGSITIGFAGIYYGAVAGTSFVGCTGGLRTLTASRNGTNTSPRTVTTGSSPVSGDYGLYFGSHRRTTGTVTIDKGSSLQTVSNTEGSAALYGGALGSSGAVTANFTYSPLGTGDYQAVVITSGAGA